MEPLVTSHTLAADPAHPAEDACAGLVVKGEALAIVCDGVGAARAGGEAADRVVRHFVDAVPNRPAVWQTAHTLRDLALQMNEALYHESQARFGAEELLCTLSAVLVSGKKAYGLNTGDSPVFHFRAGQLTLLTQSHTSEASGESHVLTQAMGLRAEWVGHVFECDLEPGDLILACSDGLTEAMGAARLAAALSRRPTARSLVLEARHSLEERDEAPDDISAVIVEISGWGKDGPSMRPLVVPGEVRPGDTLGGTRLRKALVDTRRVWQVMLPDETNAVLKLPPLEAREDAQVRDAFLREVWHAVRAGKASMPRAWLPDGETVCGYFLEFIEGRTLEEVIQEGPVSIDEGVALAKFLADASQELVGMGLLHGDIKPENIIVQGHGRSIRFRLVDFGSMARPFSVVRRAGTASYLAPERFVGAVISEATEVYAIGVVLYRSLTGRYPFGEIERFQTPRFEAEARPPSHLNKSVPPWFDAVVRRALLLDPQTRYAHFSELGYDLRHPDAVEPIRAKNASLLDRNPLRFYQLLALFFAAVALFEAWWFLGRR
ncbi:bifunctional protein-serine/threonine kinase/phosphatase [Nibricoccus sp. IMCC34717]|uniref:bifunctional protein-serine/threonine kinase/phosphatase n=1 Tax=Nibricoccus sp. IMCC34717 TaxID=3034021 RepID=UPI00384E7B4C